MNRKAAKSTPTVQGTTVSHVGMADLYETRHGLFGGGVRTLWDEGESPAPAPAPVTPPAAPPADPGTGTDALNRALAGLLSRHGSTDAVALHLLNENHTLREARRTLQGQVPAEGAVVLTPEQAQQWQAYQQLSPDPAQLRTRLTDGTAALEREQGRELAQVGQADSTVLMDRLRAAGLRAEVREVPGQNGAAATRAVHVLNAEGQDQGELRAYATQHWAAYVPALFPQAASGGAGQGTGTVVTGQAGAGTGAAGNGLTSFADRILAERQAAANPTSGGTA